MSHQDHEKNKRLHETIADLRGDGKQQKARCTGPFSDARDCPVHAARQATQPNPQSPLSELSTFPAKWRELAKVSERVGGQEMCAEELEELLRRHRASQVSTQPFLTGLVKLLRSSTHSESAVREQLGHVAGLIEGHLAGQPSQVSEEPGQDFDAERIAECIIAICGSFVPSGWAHPGDKCAQLITKEVLAAFHRGQRAMAEKAAQLLDAEAKRRRHFKLEDSERGLKNAEVMWQMGADWAEQDAKAIRSLAKPKPITQQQRNSVLPLNRVSKEQMDVLKDAVEPPQDKLLDAILLDAILKIEKLGKQLQDPKHPDFDPVCGQRIMGCAILIREAREHSVPNKESE